MADIIFYIIVGFLIFDYIFERILDYLNSTYWSDELPVELAGIYDAERYKKSQQYIRVSQKFAFLVETFSFILMLGMLLLSGFAFVDDIVRSITIHPIWMSLLFLEFLDWQRISFLSRFHGTGLLLLKKDLALIKLP